MAGSRRKRMASLLLSKGQTGCSIGGARPGAGAIKPVEM
jgi:hypothetical protein